MRSVKSAVCAAASTADEQRVDEGAPRVWSRGRACRAPRTGRRAGAGARGQRLPRDAARMSPSATSPSLRASARSPSLHEARGSPRGRAPAVGSARRQAPGTAAVPGAERRSANRTDGRSWGSSPALTTEDLPEPEGPTTAVRCGGVARAAWRVARRTPRARRRPRRPIHGMRRGRGRDTGRRAGRRGLRPHRRPLRQAGHHRADAGRGPRSVSRAATPSSASSTRQQVSYWRRAAERRPAPASNRIHWRWADRTRAPGRRGAGRAQARHHPTGLSETSLPSCQRSSVRCSRRPRVALAQSSKGRASAGEKPARKSPA